MSGERSRDFVQSLAKGLDVIASFTAERRRQTLSEVARNAGLTRATARRFLLTLTELGYVERDGDRFSLRPTVLQIGRSYLSMLTMPDIAEPHMRALASSIGEDVGLVVLDELDGVVVAECEPGRAADNFVRVGQRIPALASASGRVLLAQLPEDELAALTRGKDVPQLTESTQRDLAAVLEEVRRARRAGYTIVDNEFQDGVQSVALPVYAGINQHPAAMVISVRSRRVSPAELVENYLPQLQHTAHRIEADYTRTLSSRR
ncbi:IclR family transcriptional regulator C-terminal domain-containing protein [Blastococcus sp. Marseille-P5729]|uniref:IclR family transcriptional regulator domain-containing protein n=1 Tax=Blastococcus sp. Marseille-P5729 TaxID=2086582 RepID=UPI00131DD24C|nr:IclR family transcriptional regulator C-terminal domain-containing protein [Blastococcus sp. Marseille-P5729]